MKKYVIAFAVLLFAVSLALFAGNGAMDTETVWKVLTGNGSEMQRVIIFQIRIPRIIAALCAGSAFAVSGYLLQNNLNNVIASPGLLGINNGAGLFVLISAMLFPYQSGIKCMMAFAGALLAAFIVSVLSAGTGMSKTSVILSGVAISFVCSSVSQLIISVKPETVTDKAAFSIGGFTALSNVALRISVPVVCVCLCISFLTAGSLDIMLLGDETAKGLGLNLFFYRMLHIVLASLLAGAAVSMCGLVGFVGLIVPNTVRLYFHRNAMGEIALCTVIGAVFLLLCDTVARLVVFPYELPCGLILSVLGTPFLIRMLIKKRKRLGTYDAG